MEWLSEDGRRKTEGRNRHGEVYSNNTWRRCVILFIMTLVIGEVATTQADNNHIPIAGISNVWQVAFNFPPYYESDGHERHDDGSYASDPTY